MIGRRTGELAGSAGVVAVLGAAVAIGCGPAVAMYPGPRRPDWQVAIIEPRGVSVVDVDHAYPPMGSRYAVLGGQHALLLSPNVFFEGQGSPSTIQTRVCLEAVPGHTYLVRPVSVTGVWRPEIVDGATMHVVAMRVIDPMQRRCPARSFFVARSDTPAVSAGSSPPAANGEQPAGAAVAPITGAIDHEQPVVPGQPPPRRVDAIDEEAPLVPLVVHPRSDGRVVAHPGTGFGVGTGLAFGGDKLATARFSDGSTDDLSTGDGFVFQFIGAVTPGWVGNDAVGFGLGGEIGVKYASIGDSSTTISITRFPAIAFAQMVAPAGTNGSFLLRVGVETDLGVSVSSNAQGLSGSADLSSRTGFMAETGLWYQFNQVSAMTITVRFTHIRYGTPIGSEIDGTSGGVMLGFLFGHAN